MAFNHRTAAVYGNLQKSVTQFTDIHEKFINFYIKHLDDHLNSLQYIRPLKEVLIIIVEVT